MIFANAFRFGSVKQDEKQAVYPDERVEQAVLNFVKMMHEVSKMQITDIVVVDAVKDILRIEAQIYAPTVIASALGVAVQKEMHYRWRYSLMLDEQRNVVSFYLKRSGH